MSNYPFIVSGDKPVFLLSWDWGWVVEVHTVDSMREMYEETNLFDDDDGWGWEIKELMTFEELLEHLTINTIDMGKVFHNDNMTIQRIK